MERNRLRDAKCVFVDRDISSAPSVAGSLTGAMQVGVVSVGAGAGAREVKNAIVEEGGRYEVVGTDALDGGGCWGDPSELDGTFLFVVHGCLRFYFCE